MAIHVALLLALAETLALAAVLLHWADRVPGARLLVGFLLGVAVWIVGNELPSWTGPVAQRPALMLLATAAVTSAVFLHFALAFSRVVVPRVGLALIYGVGVAATLAAVFWVPGRFVAAAGLAAVAVPNGVGWGVSIVWAALAGLGQLSLLRRLVWAQGLERRQVAAVTASSAWGLLCMSGYGIPALGLSVYPWPLLGLPLYPVILVYGVLRYRVLIANAWARRALGWTLLVGLAGLVAGAIGAAVPLLRLPGAEWLSGVVAGIAVLVLGGPVRRLAERGGLSRPHRLRRRFAAVAREPRHRGQPRRTVGAGGGHAVPRRADADRRGVGDRARHARHRLPRRPRLALRARGVGRGTARGAPPGRVVRRGADGAGAAGRCAGGDAGRRSGIGSTATG